MKESDSAQLEKIHYSDVKICDHFRDNMSIYEVVVKMLLERDYHPPCMRATTVGNEIYTLDNELLFAYQKYIQVRQRWGLPTNGLVIPVSWVEAPQGFTCKAQIRQADVDVLRPVQVGYDHTIGTNVRPAASHRWASRSVDPVGHRNPATVASDALITSQSCVPSLSQASNFAIRGHTCADFDGREYGKEYLIFSKGDVVYKTPCPVGPDTAGWMYGFLLGACGATYGWLPPNYWKQEETVAAPSLAHSGSQHAIPGRGEQRKLGGAVRSPSAASTSRPPAPPIPAKEVASQELSSTGEARFESTTDKAQAKFIEYKKHADDDQDDGGFWDIAPPRRQTSRPRPERLGDSDRPHSARRGVEADWPRTSPKAKAKAALIPSDSSSRAQSRQRSASAKEQQLVQRNPPGVPHRAWVRDLENLDDEAAKYVVNREPTRDRSRGPAMSTPSSPMSDLGNTAPRRSRSQPPAACDFPDLTPGTQRNKAELEVGALLKRWFSAYLLLSRGRQKPARVVTDLLQKVAPELVPYLTSPSRATEPPSVDAAWRTVDQWISGSGASLGPFNQVEKHLQKMKMEVNRCEGQLDAQRRVGSGPS